MRRSFPSSLGARPSLLLALALLVALLPAERPAVAGVNPVIRNCTEGELDAAFAEVVQYGGVDVITFACEGGPSTITFSSTKVIGGNSGITDLRIDGGALVTFSGAGNIPLFRVEPNTILELENLTLSGGSATEAGGAIFNAGRLTLDTVVLRDNQAANGGAIYNAGALQGTAVQFMGNTASGSGGALANGPAATATLAGSTLEGNAATTGGAIYSTGALTATQTTAQGNRATSGGGLHLPSGTATLLDVILRDNTATLEGAGLLNGSSASFGGTMSGNSAGGAGGALYNTGTLNLTNATLSDNRAGSDGGGIANLSVINANNTTVAGNSASGDGGGIAARSGTTTIANTILIGNTDANTSAADCVGTLASNGNNLISTQPGCEIGGTVTGNVVTDTPNLAPLADNGGPTPTRALLPGSPAVDAGNTATCVLNDQRGVARSDGDQQQSFECDIGAYELGFVITSSLDAPAEPNPRNFICETAPDNRVCTLRAAIQQANALQGLDAITIDVSEPIVLGVPGIALAAEAGDLDITDDLIIIGQGITIDGAGNPDIGGIFEISPGVQVTIAGLTIRNGRADYGAGIRNAGELLLRDSTLATNIASVSGGGITNRQGGTLTVSASVITDNEAPSGGGISNESGAVLEIRNSAISANRATGDITGGGGIANSGPASLVNVTVSDNSASADGGGITRVSGGELRLNNVTLAGNTAGGNGGGIYGNTFSNLHMSNTILAANISASVPSDCAGRITSGGHNLIGTTAGCIVGAVSGDKFGSSGPIDPMLGPLQDNGGETPTRALRSGSPAVNAGAPFEALPQGAACAPNDQRGIARPQGSICDIGASEAILADVRLGIEDAPGVPLLGLESSYSIVVSNNGPSATAGVNLTHTPASGVQLIAVQPSAGGCQGELTITCSLGTIQPNDSVTVTIVYRAIVAGRSVASASVAGAETDPDLANNAASLVDLVRYPVFMPMLARR